MTDDFRITPLTGCIGARIEGLDPEDGIDELRFARLRDELLRHKVLLIPQASLSPAAHVALGARFGELEARHPDYPTIDGLENIMVIENGPERPPDNESWHKDMTFLPDPPHCSLLQAKVLPPRGGDTMFVNMAAILADLSPPLRDFLRSLSVVHDQLHGFAPTLLDNHEHERLEKMCAKPERLRRNQHPAIGVHPLTGEAYLGIDCCFVSHFVELERNESDALLRLLRDLIREPRYQVRIAWQADDLAIWDNVSTLHYAVGDYREYRRMQRVTVSRYHGA